MRTAHEARLTGVRSIGFRREKEFALLPAQRSIRREEGFEPARAVKPAAFRVRLTDLLRRVRLTYNVMF
jgi:hypothetical protein